MTYAVRLRGTARKEYDGLPGDVRDRMLDRLIELEATPRPPDAKQLSGELQGLYRVRVGGYRIVYAVDDNERQVSVVRVRPRGRAYR